MQRLKLSGKFEFVEDGVNVKGRYGISMKVEGNPTGLLDGLLAKLLPHVNAEIDIEDDPTVPYNDQLVVDAPSGRKTTVEFEATTGKSNDIHVIVRSSQPVPTIVSQFDDPEEEIEDWGTLIFNGPQWRNVTCEFQQVASDTDDVTVIVCSDKAIEVFLKEAEPVPADEEETDTGTPEAAPAATEGSIEDPATT